MRTQSNKKKIPWGKGWGGIYINRLILKKSTPICKNSLPTLEVVDLSFKDLCSPSFQRFLVTTKANKTDLLKKDLLFHTKKDKTNIIFSNNVKFIYEIKKNYDFIIQNAMKDIKFRLKIDTKPIGPIREWNSPVGNV